MNDEPMSRMGIFFIGVLLSACTEDKATPDYTKCIDLEAKGKLDEARVACAAAKSADPASKDGLAAAAKIAAIDDKVQKDKARVEAEAAARAATDTKTRQDAEDADAQRLVGKHETAKVTGDRLNADSHTVEVILR